ncbi:MAG: hypothetical protein ACRDUS_22935 [Mycobacterium sp.]
MGSVRMVQHHETYQGVRIVITTIELVDGAWSWEAQWEADQVQASIAASAGVTYPAEEQALAAARSEVAATVDRSRIARGKP